MPARERIDLIRQVMGASHVFCTAVNELLERTLGAASGGQLVMSQVRLMLLISRPGQRFKVTDVAEILGVTNAAASRSIERLVQRGMIDRTISRDDRRAVDLSLTPLGNEMLERFEQARNAELLELLGGVPDDRLQRAVELLDQLSVLLLDVGPDEEGRCLRCGVHLRSGCVVHDVLGRPCPAAPRASGEAAHPS